MFEQNQKITVKPELKGFFWLYFLSVIPNFLMSLLWILLLILLIVGAIAGAGGAGKSNNSINALAFEDITKVDGTDDKILVYDLEGAIQSGGSNVTNTQAKSGIYTDIIEKDFKKIAEDKSIKNVVFKFNSPGGEVFASEILGDQIAILMKAKGVETGTFYYDSLAASGALLATYKNKNYVVASPYGETGSIGVRLELPNFQKLADNVGYKTTIIKAGENKDIGNPLRDPKPEELAYFQKMVDKTYDNFTMTVAKGRRIDLAKVKGLANGFVYFNDEAKGYGLVDEVGTLETAIKKAGENLGKYSTVRIKKESSIFESFGIQSNIQKMIGIDSTALDKLNKVTSLKSGSLYAIDENRL
jgi:protease IV